jgi:hypothetical protein
MDTWMWILVIAAAVVIVVATVITMAMRARKRSHLKDRFGPEYDRTVDALDSRRKAEIDLRTREEHHSLLDLRPLAPAARERYQQRWADMQANFVERPQVAVADADSMISQIMRDLGYPVDDFESNAWLVSVDHANVVAKYREGHEIYNQTVAGTATTEDLRQAVLAYRELFDDLMRESVDAEQHSP